MALNFERHHLITTQYDLSMGLHHACVVYCSTALVRGGEVVQIYGFAFAFIPLPSAKCQQFGISDQTYVGKCQVEKCGEKNLKIEGKEGCLDRCHLQVYDPHLFLRKNNTACHW